MDSDPLVSVIMPIRNEAGFIAESLGAVLRQRYPSGFLEVIIADGMSTDSTREIIRRLSRSCPNVPVRLLDNPEGIVASGFNRALAEAKGDVIVRVDGHTIIEPEYVSECVRALRETDAENVGGRMRAVGRGLVGEAIALATSSPFGIGGARFHFSNADEWVDTVYLGAWRRETFTRIGMFDEEMVRNQDDEFNYRLRKAGGKILLRSNIKSHYFNRSSLSHLWKQYFQYGYWKVRVMQKHGSQMQLRHFVPPIFVLALLVGAILSFLPSIRVAWLALLSLYFGVNVCASLLESARHGWRYALVLPIVFGTLHVGYGCGFLVGLARFWPPKQSGRLQSERSS